jgi:hypothetical protein
MGAACAVSTSLENALARQEDRRRNTAKSRRRVENIGDGFSRWA